MNESFRGGVAVTGLTQGETKLTLRAGSVTKILPVTVYTNLFPKLTAVGLTPVGDASYAVEYAGTTWNGFGIQTLTLTDGDYSLEDSKGFNADSNIYFTLVNKADETVYLRTNNSGSKPRRMRATLPAGDYLLTFASQGGYSGTVTPIIRKL